MCSCYSLSSSKTYGEIEIVKLTLYTDYSLRVLLYLASKSEETATITEISEFYNISRNHLVKVVHSLGIHEFITTSRGRNGGLRLARPATEILLSDVVRKTEPDMDLLECFNPKTDNCVISPTCRLKSMLYEGRSAFMAVLEKSTLADMAKPALLSRSGQVGYVDVSRLRR